MTGLVDALSTPAAAFVGAHRTGVPATDHDQVFNKTARRVYRRGQ
jgi:predicted TIM-barrel fold metal-dependent hydrolase